MNGNECVKHETQGHSYHHVLYIYIYISKHVRLKTAYCFLFKIFKWRRSSLLMSGSVCGRKYPKLAQERSTISLVVYRGRVKLFVALNFIYIYLECFILFCFLDGVGSFCYGGW